MIPPETLAGQRSSTKQSVVFGPSAQIHIIIIIIIINLKGGIKSGVGLTWHSESFAITIILRHVSQTLSQAIFLCVKFEILELILI
jgi:hypothetical protein